MNRGFLNAKIYGAYTEIDLPDALGRVVKKTILNTELGAGLLDHVEEVKQEAVPAVLLPPHVRLCTPLANKYILLFEFPEHVGNFQAEVRSCAFNVIEYNSKLPKDSTHKIPVRKSLRAGSRDEYRSLHVPVIYPNTLVSLSLRVNKSANETSYSLERLRVYCTRNPITNLNEPLYGWPGGNIHDDHRLCMGDAHFNSVVNLSDTFPMARSIFTEMNTSHIDGSAFNRGTFVIPEWMTEVENTSPGRNSKGSDFLLAHRVVDNIIPEVQYGCMRKLFTSGRDNSPLTVERMLQQEGFSF